MCRIRPEYPDSETSDCWVAADVLVREEPDEEEDEEEDGEEKEDEQEDDEGYSELSPLRLARPAGLGLRSGKLVLKPLFR
jgi:hypothetical protein